MKLFPWQKPKPLFTKEEDDIIVNAIREAERTTSGEVRVFIESKCKYVEATDRAAEIFYKLKMDKTDDRNAALVYIAYKDHQLAVWGDEGIHKKVGDEYWQQEVNKMIANFNGDNMVEGIRQCVASIGDALHFHFPYDKDTDKNELPDEIVFGK